MSEPLPVPDPAETLADQRAGPGIVVLSASMQLLHMNRQASELAKQINVAEHGGSNSRAAHGVLPTALTELCGDERVDRAGIPPVCGQADPSNLDARKALCQLGPGLAGIGRTCSTTTTEYGPGQGKVFAYQP